MSCLPLTGLFLVLSVAPFVFHQAEAVVLTKCGLKSQLDAAFVARQPRTVPPPPPSNQTANNTTNPPPAVPPYEDLVAKIVCKAEQTTGFNTKARTVLSNNPSGSEQDDEEESEPETLYGIFQLSDRVACTNGEFPSANLCRMSCASLVNNNIADDISCLLNLLQGSPTNVQLPQNCVASTYFSTCV